MESGFVWLEKMELFVKPIQKWVFGNAPIIIQEH